MAVSETRRDGKGHEVDDDPGFPDPALAALRWFLLAMLLLAGCFVVFGAAYATHVHPRFTVQVQGLEGLDPSRNSTTVPGPAFNLTIHVDNKDHLRRVCFDDDMAVVVYYNEASEGYNETSVGWSTLPAFCVDRWSAVDLAVTLPKDGVFLSQTVRDKIARDRQGAGARLSVEIKPIDPGDASTACFRSCETKLADRPVPVPCWQCC